MSYKVINLKDIYDSLGETKDILKNYKCEINKDVEYFLKDKTTGHIYYKC